MGGIGVIAFTRKGCLLARRLGDELSGLWPEASISICGPDRFADELDVEPYGSLASWTAAHFTDDEALVFVGASGIAVRAIAPHVHDKFTDPAVVSVDEAGRFVVPLLSGHVGGANELARAIASIVGGQAVVSTATDVNGLFAVDEWAVRHGLALLERSIAKEISAAVLEGRSVGYASDFTWDDAPTGFVEGPATLGFVVSLDDTVQPFERTLHLVPKAVTVGVGCRRGTDPAVLAQAVSAALVRAGISKHAVTTVASVDLKKDERAILALADEHGWETKFYTADELMRVPGDFESSEFVKKTVGVDNVCERAACAESATLVLGKQAGDGVTVAIACKTIGNQKESVSGKVE